MFFVNLKNKSMLSTDTKYKLSLSVQLVLIFSMTCILAYWRFWPWEPKAFFADDLHNLWAFYEHEFASTLKQSLAGSFVDKYRPIWALVSHFSFKFFEKEIGLYLALNLFIQGINGVLFFLIASRLAKGNFFIPFGLAIVFSCSRFALYQITQVTGLVESVALIFFLTMFYALLRSFADKNFKQWQWFAIFSITLAIYTHERYVVVLPWLALIFWIQSKNEKVTFTYRCCLTFTCIAILILNSLIKIFLLHIPFFIGASGTPFTLDIPLSITHIREVFFSIVGFNQGPAYLIGSTVPINPFSAGSNMLSWLAATLFSLSFFYVNAQTVFLSPPQLLKQNIAYLAATAALICLLLLPPILTIRVEGRWEYAPFILVLLTFAWSYGAATRQARPIIGLISIIACLSAMSLDSIICKSFNGIYMVGAAKFSEALQRDILPIYSTQQSNELLLLIDQGSCEMLIASRFLELYTNKKPMIYCAQNKDDFLQLNSNHPYAGAFAYDANFRFIPAMLNKLV